MDLRTASQRMLGCKAESAAQLPRRWQEAEPDTQALMALIRLSAAVRDRRIYAQVLATVLDDGRPIPVRAAALTVLGTYMYPLLIGRVTQNPQGVISAIVGYRTQGYQEDGFQPVDQTEYAEIIRVVRRLASENGQDDVREIARYILSSVTSACSNPNQKTMIARCPD